MKRATVPRGKRWSEARRRVPDIGAVFLAVTALVGVLAALSFLGTLPRQLDLIGSRPYRVTGVVTEVRYSPLAYESRTKWTHPPPRLVLLSVDRQDFDVSAPRWNAAPRLKLGERVNLTYRRGKSGIRYADEVEELRSQNGGREGRSAPRTQRLEYGDPAPPGSEAKQPALKACQPPVCRAA